MSCFDGARQWCQLICNCSDADPVQATIIRQLLSQVLVTIDEVYSVEPTPIGKIKEQIDKYIDRKVDEKIQELLEFCHRAEARAKARAIKNSSSMSSRVKARMLTGQTTSPGCSSDSDMEEIPLDEVSVEIPGRSADNSRKKSVFKRIFKWDSKTDERTEDETSFCLKNIFKKFPDV